MVLTVLLPWQGWYMDTPERIRSRVTIDPTTGCWLWCGAVDSQGYGAIKVQGRMRGVHRVMLIATAGPLPDGYQVDHRCHTTDTACPGGKGDPHRRCCNPAHLEAVPPAVNRDRSKAGFTGAVCQAGLHRIDLPGAVVTNTTGRRLCNECRKASKRRANAAWRKRQREAAVIHPEPEPEPALTWAERWDATVHFH